jgi:dUTP diphosphatase
MRTRGFEVISDEHRKFPEENIILPTRGSKNSAGYDIYSNEDVSIEPGEKKVFWTDVKTYMQDGEVLKVYVRSSIGIKKGLVLSNGTGIIDADYFSNPTNDGNIGVCLRNLTNETQTIEKEERIAQGIFVEYLVADMGNTDKERSGGIGSTD